MTFLAAKPHQAPAVTILGVPYDATSTFRAGSRLGPATIRWASQSIETFSPVLQRDLEDVAVTDLGDIAVEGLSPETMHDAVADRVQRVGSSLPLLLGGEHSVTLGAVHAIRQRHPHLAVVQLDAHTDLRDDYEGRRLSHATVMRRIMDTVGPDSIVQLGVRAGTREEFAVARQLHHAAPRLEIAQRVWAWLERQPVYVTIDIDVLDPAEAPGTGNPEPEGASAHDLLRLVRRLGLLQVVGLDIVEVSPPFDPSGRTAVLAATIVREAILATRGVGGHLESRPDP